MPDRCVVFGCSNLANTQKGISLHRIPFWDDERPEAKRRRKIWVNFVATKRAKWTPSKFSAICSEHFNPEDYEKYLVEIPGTKDYTPRLKKDEIGIVLYFHCSFRLTKAKLRAFKNGDKLINFSLDKVGERQGWSRLRGGGREDTKCLSDLAVSLSAFER